MNRFKKLVIAAGLIFSMSATIASQTEAATTHTVKSGETYYKIAVKHGVPVKKLMSANNAKSSALNVGKNLTIPNSTITAAEKDLMARLVRAEAVGEPYAGKVAVATVILNRVASKDFPNTIEGVVNQVSNGHYAFTPVQNGAINKAADAASKRAVNEAIAYQGQGNGSLFFYNPKTAVSKWIFSRKTTVTIGNHRFAK
ncbi:LysM peptidoglycan-binding domain-containing protein [Neobacillus notoginsengisoli]|uniref:LysM peptidoglycan-binding domain-containing protein n=1 Tax=Neobacillus notoginsengisoli TaxID=1578198 RepID=A0A417YWS3_9BACI|nr:cell wall hydrolase [Neobacillus notoginsengisoli]RHW42006.1 LysM peptidoglycan-binding domain-containing protein [Neobacillus notoginsengisoli]